VTRIILPILVLAAFGGVARATDPATSRPSAKPKPARLSPNPYLHALASVIERDQDIARDMIDLLAKPQPRVGEFLLRRHNSERYNSDPNFRMLQLLNESEDLRQARKQFQQFWMNNQPSVLEYKHP